MSLKTEHIVVSTQQGNHCVCAITGVLDWLCCSIARQIKFSWFNFVCVEGENDPVDECSSYRNMCACEENNLDKLLVVVTVN